MSTGEDAKDPIKIPNTGVEIDLPDNVSNLSFTFCKVHLIYQ